MANSQRALGGALLTGLLLAGGASDAGLFDVVATGHDAVTTPNHAVRVSAKFERSGIAFFDPDITDEPAELTVGTVALQARTNRDGVARRNVIASRVATIPVRSKLTRMRGPTAEGRLFVLDPNRPVAVVDIDGTLSDLPDWRVPFQGATAPTFPGAPELLRDLARTHTIIYLTARDDAFDAISRRFLLRHAFPDGPVLYNDLGLTSLDELSQLNPHSHGEFKLRVIRGLMARGVNVTLGIGNAETDAYAYENAGLPSFINTTQVGTGPSFRFDDYALLRLELIAQGILPAGPAPAGSGGLTGALGTP